MITSKKAKLIIKKLKECYPNSKCALDFSSPWELLVATILSAQCTDVRVNIVTTELFKKYKGLEAYVSANQSEFEQDIHSTGFFRNKAKNILKAAKIVQKDYSGIVPNSMSELIKLPGVGRKTANVLLGTAFNIAEGIVVDTHVGRLSRRIGFTEQTNPELVERDLMKIIPKKDWILFSHLLILHGRKRCPARKPDCSMCEINQDCLQRQL